MVTPADNYYNWFLIKSNVQTRITGFSGVNLIPRTLRSTTTKTEVESNKADLPCYTALDSIELGGIKPVKQKPFCLMMICCIGLLRLTTLSSEASAQGSQDNLKAYIELAAPDIRAKTMEIIKGSMNFTEEEGKVFWPLYREYESELGAITDRTVAILKNYETNRKTLSEAKAKELAQQVFEIDEQKLNLNRKYYAEFSKVLPQTRVLYVFQLFRRIDTLLSLRIASILPMIGEDW